MRNYLALELEINVFILVSLNVIREKYMAAITYV